MSSESAFQPLWASPPGETIAELLRRKKIDFASFASDLGESEDDAYSLISGASGIDHATAERLRDIVGGSVSFWLKREAQYREDVARLRNSEDAANWLKLLPLRDMAAFGWIKRFRDKAEQTKECLRFFGVPDIKTWRSNVLPVQSVVAFRASNTVASSPSAVSAWLRQGEVIASTDKCARWNSKKFAALLPEIRSLTRVKNPEIFLPKLKELCDSCGVAVVVLRAPTGCRVSGATRFLSDGKALLLLSFRYRSDDHFWFTFFHEAGHLLLHDNTALFVEGANLISTAEEEEADRFSERVLIPAEYREEMLALPLDRWKIARFARKIGISPGIVVGQLQHSGHFPHDQMNRFKVRYVWSKN